MYVHYGHLCWLEDMILEKIRDILSLFRYYMLADRIFEFNSRSEIELYQKFYKVIYILKSMNLGNNFA